MLIVISLFLLIVVAVFGSFMVGINFNLHSFEQHYKQIFQNQIVHHSNMDLIEINHDHFMRNGSGLNYVGLERIQDIDGNDDNDFCYENFGSGFVDDDCRYRSLYGFLPPDTKLNLGTMPYVSGQGVEIKLNTLSGSYEGIDLEIIDLYDNKTTYRPIDSYNKYIPYSFEGNSMTFNITNNSENARMEYFMYLTGNHDQAIRHIDFPENRPGEKEFVIDYSWFWGIRPVYRQTQKVFLEKRPSNPIKSDLKLLGEELFRLTWQHGNLIYPDSTCYMILATNSSNTLPLNIPVNQKDIDDFGGEIYTGSKNEFCSNGKCRLTETTTNGNFFQVHTYIDSTNGDCSSQDIFNIKGSFLLDE